MGQNTFRFTLSHSSGSQVIDEPEGWAKIKITLERDKEYFSLIEIIETPFIFYGSNGVYDGGMNFLLEKKRNYGVDAQISITIEISQNEFTYETLFLGLIDMQSFRTIDSRKLEVVILRNDFWAKFVSRRENAVDILSTTNQSGGAVTPISSIPIDLTSQPILSKYKAHEKAGLYLVNVSGSDGPLIQYQPDVVDLDEIPTAFNLGRDFNPELPVWVFAFLYEGVTIFDIRYEVSRTSADGFFSPREARYAGSDWRFYIKINDLVPVQFTSSDAVYTDPSIYSSWNPLSPGYSATDIGTMISTYNATINIKAGDIVRIYMSNTGTGGSIVFWGMDGQPSSTLTTTVGPSARPSGMIENPSFLNVTQNTIFPDSQANGFFIHDVGAEIIKRITDEVDSFYSEYTGSTQTLSRTYAEDGCGWNFALMRGLQIRKYSLSDKPFSISFKQWWEGANPIYNLGLGYDVISGQNVIRVEDKAFFFNDSPIIYFDFVNNIEESYDKDFIFNKVKIGYKKWQSEDILGIDDPQTNHEYALLFKTVGVPITLQSDFIAASLAIETTRRKTIEQSADYKFDDDTFIIAINPVEAMSSPAGYLPELDENFDSVSNLLNPTKRYNLVLTPLRNLIRWANVLGGCLQDYLTSVYKFNGGEGNYDAITDYSGSAPGICFNKISDSLSEKQDLSMAYNSLLGHLFRPEILEFKFPLSWTNYKLIRDNRTRAIAVSESDSNHVICHIKRLDYDVLNSVGTFTVWRK